MEDDLFELPRKPFFSCEEDGFSIVDAEQMRSSSGLLSIQPALKLLVGEGNIFENRPRKVRSHENGSVVVECDGDVTVVLDFEDLAARIMKPTGEFLYLGGIEQGNDGRGYMAAR